MKSKKRALEVLRSYGDQDSLNTFTEPRSTPEYYYIANVGERFLLKLYGAVRSTWLNKLRYILYTRSVSRSSLSSGFKLESLPPTAAAARFHSYRAYLAVQQWIGNNVCPTDWGWQYRNGSLVSLHIGQERLHVCCESCRAVARQVVGRHADAGRQGCTVHPCAVTVMDKHASTFMC